MKGSVVEEIVADGGYAIVDRFLTPSSWSRPQVKITPKGGIIHWTANIGKGADAPATRNYFEGLNDRFASSHTIGDDRIIIAALPYLPGQAEMAYHVGALSYRTDRFGSYPNDSTLGHEMCVNADGNFRESYKRAVWVMAHWSHLYRWNPQTAVARHYDITGKGCPLPFLEELFDDAYVRSLGYTPTQIEWIRTNLHIDGVQGEALWKAYVQDVSELTDILNEGESR
ncbi:N-acetylmuramoyl-L-alanine amidase [Paenibacillus sp. CC-CFT747]|nr:N-acetylmuramoyl-L-alanine amidase [Paenibacillus sp. CC-CFT747]